MLRLCKYCPRTLIDRTYLQPHRPSTQPQGATLQEDSKRLSATNILGRLKFLPICVRIPSERPSDTVASELIQHTVQVLYNLCLCVNLCTPRPRRWASIAQSKERPKWDGKATVLTKQLPGVGAGHEQGESHHCGRRDTCSEDGVVSKDDSVPLQQYHASVETATNISSR